LNVFFITENADEFKALKLSKSRLQYYFSGGSRRGKNEY